MIYNGVDNAVTISNGWKSSIREKEFDVAQRMHFVIGMIDGIKKKCYQGQEMIS